MMQTFIIGLATVVSLVFIVIVMITNFKGRATVDDQIARLTGFLALGFVVAMLIADVLAKK
jgi:DMSO/TMAO reductase YedYZ heme-binding membrane subunit